MTGFYLACIFQAKEGGFVIEFPDIPEAFTQAENYAECMEMAEDVLNVSLEEYVRERKKLPEPSNFEEAKKFALKELQENPDTLDTNFDPLVQIIKTADMSQKPVKVTVSFPKSYLQDIDKKAERLGMTRSGFLVKAALAYK